MAIGIDYASVDRNGIPDFPAARDSGGAQFAIVRRVYGRSVTTGSKTPYIDPTGTRDRASAKTAGLKWGEYMLLCYPRKGIYTPEPEEQAQALCDNAQIERGADMPPWLDVEEESDVLTATEMLEWTKRAWHVLDNFYGIAPGIYTSARVWNDNLRGADPGEMRASPLWLAKPWPWATNATARLGELADLQPTPIPQFGSNWFLYQRQGDAIRFPGLSATVDISRARVFGQGANGDHVRWTQGNLGINMDGAFGPLTARAVKELQARAGLKVDGFVGLNTFIALAWNRAGVIK